MKVLKTIPKVLKMLLEIFSEIVVADQLVGKFSVLGEPSGIPVLDDAHAKTVGIDFLSHKS